MRWLSGTITAGVLGAILGCGTTAPNPAVADNLKRDLEAVSASSVQLASAQAGYNRASVVSQIEQTNGSVPIQRAPQPTRRPKGITGQGDTQRTPDSQVANEVQTSETPAPQPEVQVAADDVPRVPTVSPRPVPAAVDNSVGATDGRGRVGGGMGPPSIEDVIGVVIRGGGGYHGGPDHDRCEPRGRRPIGRGFPLRIGVGIAGGQILDRIVRR